jgi:hypothetical protein
MYSSEGIVQIDGFELFWIVVGEPKPSIYAGKSSDECGETSTGS